MRCPSCYSEQTRVIDSRLGDHGESVRRRRECRDCEHRFTTFERVFLEHPRVVKSDGRRESWNGEKLRRGILRALEKRPVGVDRLEALVEGISTGFRLSGEREITAKQIGQEGNGWVTRARRSGIHSVCISVPEFRRCNSI